MNLEEEVQKIIERNKKVEADKAWETSLTRKAFVCLLTYALVSIVMIYIGVQNPFLNALIPTLGFFLSTLTLGLCKKIWIAKIYGKR